MRRVLEEVGATEVPVIDVYNPVYTPFALPTFGAEAHSTQTQAGLYLQDQMDLGRWHVLAGLRREAPATGDDSAKREC